MGIDVVDSSGNHQMGRSIRNVALTEWKCGWIFYPFD